MVKGFLNFFNKEVSGIHQAAYLLAFFAIFSQILALVRDKLLAFTFGAGSFLDVYYAAFRVPDFIFVTIGSIVSMTVIIPFLMERLSKSREDARKLIDSVFTVFFVVIVIVALIAFAVSAPLLKFLFPGFLSEQLSTLVIFTRILLLSPIILGISNLFGSLTQSSNKYLVYGLSPVLYNVGIIFGIIVFLPVFGLAGLVWGVVLGAILHLLIQVPAVFKMNLIPRFTKKVDFPLVIKTFATSIPRTLALSFTHLSILALLSLASTLSPGSISIFNFSFNLQSVPLSIIGVSYSLAVFPTISKLYVQNRKDDLTREISSSARHIIFWSIPFTVIFIVLRAHIVRIILGSGNFDWADTRLTAAALALFAFSLFLQNLSLLIVRGFYATGNTKTPLVVNFISAGTIIISAYWFLNLFNNHMVFRFFIESLFKVSDIPGTSVLMLPLAYTAGSIVNGIVLLIIFGSKLKGFVRSIFPTFFQSLSASVIMGAFIFLSLRVFDNIFSLDRFFGLLGQAFFSATIGIAVGVLILLLLKNNEIKTIWANAHQKFWKKAVIVGPDPEVV